MTRVMNKVTAYRLPADGAPGKRGPILRGPMDWNACQSGFPFQSGGENDTYLDCVIYNGVYYMCKTSHSKGSSFAAAQWQTAAQIPFVATMLMLATNARINFLSGQAIRVGDGSKTYGYMGAPAGSEEIIYTGRSREVEVVFSTQSSPANPSGHPNTVSAWTSAASTASKWMAVSACRQGTWDSWTTIQIGASTPAVVFRRGQTRPNTPSGTSPSGWSGTVPSGSDPLWYSIKSGSAWSEPAAVGNVVDDYSPSQATFALYMDGKARWGLPGGQRIEINPNTRDMQVYDTNGTLRTTVSGSRREPAAARPGGGSETSFTAPAVSDGTLPGLQSFSSTKTAVSARAAASAGSVVINVPMMTLTAVTNAKGETTAGGINDKAIPYTNVTVTVTLKVDGVTKDSVTYYCNAQHDDLMIDGGSHGGLLHTDTNTVATPGDTLTASVQAGQTITVTVTTSVTCSGGTGTGGSGNMSSGTFSGKFVYNSMQCFYGSNGFSLSTDSDNYVFFLFDTSGKLHARCVSEGEELFKTSNES